MVEHLTPTSANLAAAAAVDAATAATTTWPKRSCLGTSSQMSCLMFHEKQANVMSKSQKIFSRGIAAQGKCHRCLLQ
jgi:hypothetical protein